MHELRIAVALAWIAFWVYWLISAVGVKRATPGRGGMALRIAIAMVVIAGFRILRPGNFEVHSIAIAAVGTTIVFCGLGFAVWARVYLGRNWGMPMSRKEDPELITAGPYRLVRHPIYTGLLAAVIGTALAIDLLALIVAVIAAALFFYSARIEEQNMTEAFPDAYPTYMARTKMLVPFVF